MDQAIEKKLSNQAIVSGVRQSDPRAVSALYMRFGPRINRIVWRLLGADPEHDDLVQEVFIQAMRSMHSLKNSEALGSWLAQVAVHCVHSEIRRRCRHRKVFAAPEEVQEVTVQNQKEPLISSRVYAPPQGISSSARTPALNLYLCARERLPTCGSWRP